MKTIILAGWFLITTHGKDETHNYLLEDRQRNIFIALSIDKPLPYPVGTWGKFIIKAGCDNVITANQFGQQLKPVKSKFCNADNYKIAPCKRPIIIGGIEYCE